MKSSKLFKLVIIATLIFGWISLFPSKKSTNNDLIKLENIEALANPEVDIPGVCAVVDQTICMVFSDGYFLMGVRVA